RRPSGWKTKKTRPHLDTDNPTGGQQQGENKQLRPGESEPPALGLRCIGLRLNRDHRSFVRHSLSRAGSSRLPSRLSAARDLIEQQADRSDPDWQADEVSPINPQFFPAELIVRGVFAESPHDFVSLLGRQ